MILGSCNHGYGHEPVIMNNTALPIVGMAPTVTTLRIKLLPRQRRLAAMDTAIWSSSVTSVVTATAGT